MYSKIEYLKEGKIWKPSFFEYVNRHFSAENITCGSTYSTSWVHGSERKQLHDDNDDWLIYLNLINNNSRHNCCSIAAAAAVTATDAFVVVFAIAVAVLCAFTYSTGTQTNQKYLSDHENRRNLVNFQCIQLILGSMFIRIERTVRFGRCIVPFYQATVLKKSVCVCK